jgi:hypothetical protein
MEKHAHSASALAEPSNKYTSVDDTSTPLAVEMGEVDEQIGESRAGTVEKTAWGFRKVVWIGGVVFVGTVIAALVFALSSAAKSPDPHSVTQLQHGFSTTGITDGGTFMLKNNLSAFYLHVSSRNQEDGDQVFHTDSTTPGSQWQIEYVGGSDTLIMLRNLRSGFYLHVKEENKNSGDSVYQKDSASDGSKWQVEYAYPHGSLITLKSLRSGFYLQATERSAKTCCDPVFHTDSIEDATIKWKMEAPVM